MRRRKVDGLLAAGCALAGKGRQSRGWSAADRCDGMDSSEPRRIGARADAGGALRGAGVSPGPADDAPELVVREIPVAVGDRIRATVAALADGVAMLGYRGSLFTAKVGAALEPGATYDFVVARTEPRVELALATTANGRAAQQPSPQLLAGSTLADAFATLLRALRGKGVSAVPSEFARAADAWSRGDATADALRTIVRSLGHDHEARVSALASLEPQRRQEAANELRNDAKALALLVRDDDASAPQQRDAASTFVAAMSAQERDNAVRKDAGLPLWLPLPACPQQGLEEARMFVFDRDGGSTTDDGGEDGVRPFTIALLLDFTRLGALRVDVSIEPESQRLRATFTAARDQTAVALHAAFPDLQRALESAGLSVRELRAVRAPGGAVPVRDLALDRRDGTALVDVRA